MQCLGLGSCHLRELRCDLDECGYANVLGSVTHGPILRRRQCIQTAQVEGQASLDERQHCEQSCAVDALVHGQDAAEEGAHLAVHGVAVVAGHGLCLQRRWHDDVGAAREEVEQRTVVSERLGLVRDKRDAMTQLDRFAGSLGWLKAEPCRWREHAYARHQAARCQQEARKQAQQCSLHSRLAHDDSLVTQRSHETGDKMRQL